MEKVKKRKKGYLIAEKKWIKYNDEDGKEKVHNLRGTVSLENGYIKRLQDEVLDKFGIYLDKEVLLHMHRSQFELLSENIESLEVMRFQIRFIGTFFTGKSILRYIREESIFFNEDFGEREHTNREKKILEKYGRNIRKLIEAEKIPALFPQQFEKAQHDLMDKLIMEENERDIRRRIESRDIKDYK